MIRALSQSYTSIDSAVTITRVVPDIFNQRYFTYCLDCTFCYDVCCSYGADVSADNVTRIEAHAPALEAYLDIPREKWFTGVMTDDPEFAGGRHTRTQVKQTPRGNRCVFLNRETRGCGIHSYCLENGLDYHTLKPLVCWLFPITFDNGQLQPSLEIVEHSLICMDQGPTLYRASRSELETYFGSGLVAELDHLERETLPTSAS